MTNIIPLFTPARERFNQAWVKFRDQREAAAGSTSELTRALAELNAAIAEARAAGFYPNVTIEERRCARES